MAKRWLGPIVAVLIGLSAFASATAIAEPTPTPVPGPSTSTSEELADMVMDAIEHGPSTTPVAPAVP